MPSSIVQIKYFKNYVDSEIITFNKTPVERELISRNILNRAYYSSFLHCRKKLELDHISDISIHQDVIDNVSNDLVKRYLIQLLRYRKDADYKTIYLNKNISDLLNVQRIMNYILNLEKKDLIK
ncbi:hypothetical protein [Aliarcobacter butzleri]|uniref:hypothetical protein n=1 Tax=Aliarcobacter butzleri TaxID=28197 RepID=UPI002B244EA0|nr:hypothetical protein [Aliarcobacter butzleri]